MVVAMDLSHTIHINITIHINNKLNGMSLRACRLQLTGNLQALSDIPLSSRDGSTLVPALRTLFDGFQDKITAKFVDLRQECTKVCDEKDFEI